MNNEISNVISDKLRKTKRRHTSVLCDEAFAIRNKLSKRTLTDSGGKKTSNPSKC